MVSKQNKDNQNVHGVGPRQGKQKTIDKSFYPSHSQRMGDCCTSYD